jgi:HlyD family secretion protein
VKKVILIIVIVAIGAGVGIWYFRKTETKVTSFRTVKIIRGDFVSTITATGTVEPQELVDVGAQVAGQVLEFGKDKDGNEVDYGSFVEEGTVLAKIDDTTYTSDVAMANAQLAQAKASVENSQANIMQLKAKLTQAKLDWDRAQKLGPSEALAKSSYDSYQATYEAAVANVAVGEAQLQQSRASVDEADATLVKAKRNLGYCTIASPVKGVIIDRRVNIGQTVVSSLNAPSLFLIAKDLRQMQVWVAVNEADIGKIYPGQPVTFTCDAYPDEVFKGKVGKVRLNATMTQNVVTYTVEVETDNSSGKLLPYLTANIKFELARRNDALQVANAALRWQPTPSQMVPAEEGTAQTGSAGLPQANAAQNDSAKPKRPNQSGDHKSGERKKDSSGYHQATLWVAQGNFVKPIKVKAGVSDETMTEVQSVGSASSPQDEIKEGLEVVVGEQTKAAAATGTVNPFTPQFPGRRPQGR